MFDFYDGGGLDLTCVGLAEVDKYGNVNVSKLGPRLVGSGGFIDITQSARKCLFCGEFAAGGLDARVENGRLVIRQDGKAAKFVDTVQQITFSGKTAVSQGQEILYITERCVFRLASDGVTLTEVAPGVDIQRDVLSKMRFAPRLADPVAIMDPAIFRGPPMRLKRQA
jgi:propionate CoA-transferase